MSSRGGEHRCSERPGKPREQDKEQEEENFYDCQETLGPSETKGVVEEEEIGMAEGESEDFEIKTDKRHIEDRDHEEEQADRLQEDFDPEIEKNGEEVEFDDDYLREVEQELTEEEKEVTPSPVDWCL